MKYLVSQVEQWAEDLDALRAPDPGSRKVGKREAVLLLSKKLQGAARRGFTTAELLEALAAKGLKVHVDLLREALRTAGKVSAGAPARGRRRAGEAAVGVAEGRRAEGEGSGGEPDRQSLETTAGNVPGNVARLRGSEPKRGVPSAAPSAQGVSGSGPEKPEGAVAREALAAGSGASRGEAGSGPGRMPAMAPLGAREEGSGRATEGARKGPQGNPAPARKGDDGEGGDGRSGGAGAGRAAVAIESGGAPSGGTAGRGSFTPRIDSEII